MAEHRFLADEMLGRLARYLRFVGCDTDYARGLDDALIRRRAEDEGRTLLTRDKQLAAATPGAIRIRSATIEGQWRELRAAIPGLSSEIRFTRCSLCNGLLRAAEGGAPRAARPAPTGTFVCEACGHTYWEGSHTAAIRGRLERWSEEGSV